MSDADRVRDAARRMLEEGTSYYGPRQIRALDLALTELLRDLAPIIEDCPQYISLAESTRELVDVILTTKAPYV